jgi:uroporphyrinogen decarboxylase
MKVLRGEAVEVPPIWLMRQAGRYLPEYRATREKAGSFLDLCYNPDLAVEVTLQPIRRFGFDASILFSDILVVPHALGRDLRFVEGQGPVMTPMDAADIGRLDVSGFHGHLEPIYETVRRLRKELPEETALIGFCGAPWTVATYMIAGRGSPDQAQTRLFSFRNKAEFESLLTLLADVSAEYLCRQIEAGADAVQIFDSWCGVLDEDGFRRHAVGPVRRITGIVKEHYPNVPVIAFPKGAGSRYRGYRRETGIDCLGLDWSVDLGEAKLLQETGAVQGNLDPMRLVAGGQALSDGTRAILRALGSGPFIFNLGHGIVPETPISHVDEMIRIVRGTEG